MRRSMLGLAMAVGLLAVAPGEGRAQFVNDGDPFFLYYGFYLPRQAALAATPRPEMMVNQMAALRQESALTERAGLYDPLQPFGAGAFDPGRPFADRQNTRGRGGSKAGIGTSINGSGPPMHYNRVAGYYPNLRTGRGPAAGAALSGPRGGGSRGGGSGFQPPRTR